MAKCKESANFVPGGTVPEGKDGAYVWTEKDSKGATLWLSKPASKDDDCEKIK